MNGMGLSGELIPAAFSSEELAKLDALEHRLAELAADVGKLAQVFGREGERSPAHSIVTGCLECLLVDRLVPAGEALATLRNLGQAKTPGSSRESARGRPDLLGGASSADDVS